MKLYLQMFVKDAKPIENYSPYEIRRFLIKILTVKEWAHAEKYVNYIMEAKSSVNRQIETN